MDSLIHKCYYCDKDVHYIHDDGWWRTLENGNVIMQCVDCFRAEVGEEKYKEEMDYHHGN